MYNSDLFPCYPDFLFITIVCDISCDTICLILLYLNSLEILIKLSLLKDFMSKFLLFNLF